MCTGKFQFRKPGAVEQNQRTEKFGRPPPVFFRTSILPYDQQGAQETSKRETAEIQGGFCFEGTNQTCCFASGHRGCCFNHNTTQQAATISIMTQQVLTSKEEKHTQAETRLREAKRRGGGMHAARYPHDASTQMASPVQVNWQQGHGCDPRWSPV